MRAVLAVAALASLAVAVTTAATASTGTALRITYWEDSAVPTKSVTWTLGCGPVAGSLPRRTRACRRLAQGGVELFAPTPKNAVCTEIYGGPQRARVVGTVNGKRIWAKFRRSDGCEIARWQRLSPWLVPPGGVT
jgi:subtilisin inhibitor-like